MTKIWLDSIFTAAYPLSTSEANPASVILDAGHGLFLVSHP